jgi:hypothetical protein
MLTYGAAWLELNGLELLVRSHEMKEEGYAVEHDGRSVTYAHLCSRMLTYADVC